jgi:uncharacterized protein (TIGR02996 family)
MDQQPFLRAIRAKPEDDLPRLVYADALEESGASERAEFIRVQVALANTPEHDPQFRLLEDREHELLGKNEKAWVGTIREHVPEWTWRRGFVDELIASERQLTWLSDVDLAHQAITKIDITNHADFEGEYPLSEQLFCSTLQRLSINGPFRAEAVIPLLQCENLELREFQTTNTPDTEEVLDLVRFTSLRSSLTNFEWVRPDNQDLVANPVHDFDISDLSELFDQNQLQTLSLHAAQIIGKQLSRFLNTSAATGLKCLDVSHNPLEPDAYQAFHTANCHLEELDVTSTPLAAISLLPLLSCSSLSGLKRFGVNGTGSARMNLEVIAKSKYWTQAEQLNATYGTIQASTLEPLTKCGSLNLRHLELGGNYLRTEGVRYLCEAPWADSLIYLSLWNNYLDDESCEVLAKSGRFKNMRSLQLTQNNARQRDSNGEQITDRGIIQLCKSPALANLRMLALGHNEISDAAVAAIFKAPFTLSALHLNRTNITKHSIKTMVLSPKLARLNTLDLSDNPNLGGMVLMPLAQSPYLSPLCELDVSGIELNWAVVDAFRERLGCRLTGTFNERS